MESSNLKVWYARGFSARVKSSNFPHDTDFKQCRLRKLNFVLGWREADFIIGDGTFNVWGNVEQTEKSLWQAAKDHGEAVTA